MPRSLCSLPAPSLLVVPLLVQEVQILKRGGTEMNLELESSSLVVLN